MRDKCKGARAEIDVRLFEVATITVEARPHRKVADIRIETTNARITWEADAEMLSELQDMFYKAKQQLTRKPQNTTRADDGT